VKRQNYLVYFKNVLSGILALVKNKNWILLCTSGGLAVGTFFTFLTLLNQIIKPTFSNQSVNNLVPIFLQLLDASLIYAFCYVNYLMGFRA